MTAPQDPAAARRDRLRAGHADRELTIETLKDAFVHGQLTKGELDTRTGRALSARTRADLAALTSDLPPAPAAAPMVHPPAPAAVVHPPAPAVAPVADSPAPAPAPAAPAPAVDPFAPAPLRPLTRAVVRSGVCLVIAAAAVRIAFLLDPGPNGPPGPPPTWDAPSLYLLIAFAAVITALGILTFGVIAATDQRRSRGQLPPPPRPGGHPPDDE